MSPEQSKRGCLVLERQRWALRVASALSRDRLFHVERQKYSSHNAGLWPPWWCHFGVQLDHGGLDIKIPHGGGCRRASGAQVVGMALRKVTAWYPFVSGSRVETLSSLDQRKS